MRTESTCRNRAISFDARFLFAIGVGPHGTSRILEGLIPPRGLVEPRRLCLLWLLPRKAIGCPPR
jgi:hypothetical protein